MYEEIKSFATLEAMGKEKMLEVHNYYIDEIEKGNITKAGIKEKHNFTIGQIAKSLYDTGQYKYQNKKLVKGTRRIKNRNKTVPQLTNNEILKLREILKNGLDDFRSPDQIELIKEGSSKDKQKMLFQFSEPVAEKFEEYSKKHKRFNKSEHIMLAILEHMDKYQ